jgi:esterase/lipase superfamily enzyme
MLFLTNRMLTQNNQTRLGRRVDFELRDTNALQSLFFCERRGAEEYSEIGSAGFMQRLKDSPAEQILVFIHGFNNQPEDAAFQRAEKLQQLFTQEAPGLVEVVAVIWPCLPTQGAKEFINGYYSDQLAADASAPAFGRALARLQAWQLENVEKDEPCLKRINVLAHSMGNRVLRGAVKWWAEEVLGGGPALLFRNLFLVAADVENESLQRGHEGQSLTAATRNVVVYFSYDDLALRASKGANASMRSVSRRLGHTGPYDMTKVPANVFAVDCDRVAMRYDPKSGHTYFLQDRQDNAGKVFQHILKCVQDARPESDATNQHIIKP